MADILITLTCGDYARVMPLATADVKPDGIALTLIHGTSGSWEMRAEMLRRALDDPAVHGGEASMAGHLRRIDKGDRSFVGLPVFPLRNFTARDLYVRQGGPVRTPADLVGKRLGMYDWVASGSIWYRHFLLFIGVAPESLEWWIGDIDSPQTPDANPPLHITRGGPPAAGGALSFGDADRRRARRDLQPATAATLRSGEGTDRPPLSRHSRDRALLFPADRLLPATAPRDPAPRCVGTG
jgi:4,5-dihydroxyphthalate decarboxylase